MINKKIMSINDIDKAIEDAVLSNDREDLPPQERDELKTKSERCKKESMVINHEFAEIENS